MPQACNVALLKAPEMHTEVDRPSDVQHDGGFACQSLVSGRFEAEARLLETSLENFDLRVSH
jgi:hypothetical protein